MKALFKKFAQNESGATAIEYGLIAVGVSIAIYLIAGTVGDSLVGVFTEVDAALNAR